MRKSPLYEQIYMDIITAIEEGKYKPGERIPSEKELLEQYNVSRITSKKALEMLAKEGRIVRMAGKGSYVAEPSEESGSIVNHMVQNTSFGEVPLIGVILEGFSSAFGTILLNSMERECRNRGYSLILRCSDGIVENESKAIDDFLKLGVKGMIIMCSQDENYNPKVLQMVVEEFPVVTVDRKLKGIPVPHVGTDNTIAAKDLTKCLLEKGFRHICFVKPDAYETSSLQERQTGFIFAMNEYGLITDESNWITDLKATLPSRRFESSLDEDMDKIINHINKYPEIDAFLAAEYGIALTIYKCLRKKGLETKYPIVCFDAVENLINEYSFTYVKQNEERIGTLAVETLIEVIKGNKPSKNNMVPYEVIKK